MDMASNMLGRRGSRSGPAASMPLPGQMPATLARQDTASRKELTEQQMRDLRQIFDWLDASGNGEVSVDELFVALSSLNPNSTRKDAEALIVEALGVQQTKINWTEFCQIIERGLTQNVTATQMFEILDTNHTGQLGPDVLRAGLIRYGCDASDEAIDKMIRYIDVDGDGQVSLQEFATALARKIGEDKFASSSEDVPAKSFSPERRKSA